MADTPYPLPKGTRETDILVGSGVASYGPFTFKIFEIDDVEVFALPSGSSSFAPASVVVEKVSNLALDFFTIAFPSNVPASTKFLVRSKRTARRRAGVLKGTRINPDAVEKELSITASEQQELRRDIDRAWVSDFGQEGMTLDVNVADGDTLVKQGNRIVKGPSAATVASAEGFAQSAGNSKDASEAARDIAAGYASDAVSQGNVPIYSTIVGMAAITVPVGMNAIRVNGYADAGDGHGGLFRRYVSEPAVSVKFPSAGGVWWGIASAGRRIGDTPQLEAFDGKPTIGIGDALYFKKIAPGTHDVFDSHFYRDTTGLVGGTPGFVNSTLLVNTKTGSEETSFTWGLLSKLYNASDAGENVAIYAQSIKAGEGHTWGVCIETNELPDATYGAIVGMENALSVNGLDPANVRVVQDVLGARYDKNGDIPDIYAGVRILAGWAGEGDGVNSARFKRPLIIDANWTETAIYTVHRSGVATGEGNQVVFLDGYAFDPNQDNVRLRFARTGDTDGWTDTALQLDRYVDGVFVGRVAINGDKSVELNTGETSFRVKNGGGVVIPFYGADPPGGVEGEFYFNSTTQQLRYYTGSAWASFNHV